MWEKFISDNYLNILCVACHYSIRYSNSDEYAMRDSSLLESVFYLKNNTEQKMIDMFVLEYLQPDDENKFKGLTWKNMMYLWKHFLDKKKLPMIMFKNDFRNHILKIYSNKNYNETTEIFSGIHSRFLPIIENFICFWDKTMIYDENEDSLEIEETTILFKKWSNNNTINETQVLDLILYYYPDVKIIEEKYIQKYKCNLWNKNDDIQKAMTSFMENNENNTLYSAYNYYCKFYSGSQPALLVSKNYFDEYITENIPNILL